MDKPQPVRVDVPEEYGDVYEGQWVERVIRVSRDNHFKPIRELRGKNYLREDKVLKELAKILATLFTDWNLEGDDGPLPQPWENPEAFEALAASDINVFLWVTRISLDPVSELAATPKKSDGGGDGPSPGPEADPS